MVPATCGAGTAERKRGRLDRMTGACQSSMGCMHMGRSHTHTTLCMPRIARTARWRGSETPALGSTNGGCHCGFHVRHVLRALHTSANSLIPHCATDHRTVRSTTSHSAYVFRCHGVGGLPRFEYRRPLYCPPCSRRYVLPRPCQRAVRGRRRVSWLGQLQQRVF